MLACASPDGEPLHLLALANRGDAKSQFSLGVAYAHLPPQAGDAATANRTQSRKWLLRAAQQGLSRAQAELAEQYLDESATLGRQIRACAWLILAVESARGAFRQQARSRYDQLSARLAPEHLAKAQRIAHAWARKQQGRHAQTDLARETMNAWRL
jgi:TPR repeat protein